MSGVSEQNNFIYFTIALVALSLVSAIGHAIPGGMGAHFSQIISLAVFAVAYYTLDFGKRWRRFIGFTLALALLVAAIGVFSKAPEVALAYRVVGLIFFVGVTARCSHQVLFSDSAGTNVIVGTLAIYLLLGLIWATLYMITLYFWPGAFKGISSFQGEEAFPRMLYFSYVTLATLGYGDISPVVPVSKTLAYLQAITGTFYLAIVVASLISSRRKN